MHKTHNNVSIDLCILTIFEVKVGLKKPFGCATMEMAGMARPACEFLFGLLSWVVAGETGGCPICSIGAPQGETTASDGDFPRSAKAGQDCNAAPSRQAGEEAREAKYQGKRLMAGEKAQRSREQYAASPVAMRAVQLRRAATR